MKMKGKFRPPSDLESFVPAVARGEWNPKKT